MPGDPAERKKWNSHIRQQFDTGLNDALMFLAEEGLFIPKHICVVAESAKSRHTGAIQFRRVPPLPRN